jgi:Saxitoxin biosynthesis operon protein SxtJ
MSHESFDRVAPVKTSSDRVFGLVFAGFFAIVALLPLFSGRSPRLWSIGVGGVFLVAALVVPKALAPLNRLWMRFGLLLHRIVNPVVLSIMFFVVVTPIGLLMRALGKDPLRLRLDREARTYWIPRDPPGPAPDSLHHQF